MRAKKHMWSIQKCDLSNLGDYNTKWALQIRMLHSQSLPTSPPESHPVCHVDTHILAKLSYHSLQTSPLLHPHTQHTMAWGAWAFQFLQLEIQIFALPSAQGKKRVSPPKRERRMVPLRFSSREVLIQRNHVHAGGGGGGQWRR